MSVLVFDDESSKYFIFAKGAPEIIHNNSTVKFDYFDKEMQNVTYGGFRAIAYGYKQIPQSQVTKYLSESRDSYLKDITLLGFIMFENKLKPDALKTTEMLDQSGI